MTRTEYYRELRDHLLENVQGVRFVGWFNDQYNNEKRSQPIDHPSILIQMIPSNFRDVGAGLGLQDYDLDVTLHIASVDFDKDGEDVGQFTDLVYVAAHRFVPSDKAYGKLLRIAEEPDYDHDQVNINKVTFSVHVKDYSADNRSTKTKLITENITATIS